MKSFGLLLLLAASFLAAANPCLANGSFYTITVQNTVIALPKDQALRFLAQHQLESDPDKGFQDLLQMVEKGNAKSVANPAVTTTSGQRAINEAGAVKLEVECVLSPSLELVDTVEQFTCGAVKIGTSFMIRSGKVKFLGSFDSPDAATNTTSLVFVRVSVSKPE